MLSPTAAKIINMLPESFLVKMARRISNGYINKYAI